MIIDPAIQLRLEREERYAREQLRMARCAFKEISSQIGNRVQDDGNDRHLHKAGANVQFWEKRYADTTRRLLRYLTHGILGDDEGPSGSPCASC